MLEVLQSAQKLVGRVLISNLALQLVRWEGSHEEEEIGRLSELIQCYKHMAARRLSKESKQMV